MLGSIRLDARTFFLIRRSRFEIYAESGSRSRTPTVRRSRQKFHGGAWPRRFTRFVIVTSFTQQNAPPPPKIAARYSGKAVAFSRPLALLPGRPTGRPTDRSVGRLFGRSVVWSVGRSVGRSVNRRPTSRPGDGRTLRRRGVVPSPREGGLNGHRRRTVALYSTGWSVFVVSLDHGDVVIGLHRPVRDTAGQTAGRKDKQMDNKTDRWTSKRTHR